MDEEQFDMVCKGLDAREMIIKALPTSAIMVTKAAVNTTQYVTCWLLSLPAIATFTRAVVNTW